jgi:hypothetical protein
MPMTRLTLLALPLLAGCFRLTPDDLAKAQDADGDGEDARAYGGVDCDDADASVNSTAVELCDGVDNDCDGNVDEADAEDALTFYADADGDGFGDLEQVAMGCEIPSGHVEDATDCDDSDPAVRPDAIEICNGIDDDCDEQIDPGDAAPGTWYADADADTFGDPDTSEETCEPQEGWVTDATDCDDTETDINPGAAEVCDSIDNDCDGQADEDDATDMSEWYPDLDGDGFGDQDAEPVEACDAPSDHVADLSDCNDAEPTVHPDATEICDQLDNDCDGDVDYELNVGTGAGDYSTIQAAVDAASFSSGDRICVHAGTYRENLTIDRNVWLEGEEKDSTIIDGGLAGRVLTVAGTDSAATVKGFTLTRGTSNQGAAISTNGSTLVFEDLLIKDNVAVSSGQCLGAIIHMGGSAAPEWRHIQVHDNDADCGESWGLIYTRDHMTAGFDHLSVRGNVITSGGRAKGGLMAYYGNYEVTNAVFAGNTIEHVPNGSFGDTDIRGGLFSLVQGSISLENVTIHGEQCINPAGSITGCIGYVDGGSTGSFMNVSVTGTSTSYSTMQASIVDGPASYAYSNFSSYGAPGFSGVTPSPSLGNLTATPGFEDTTPVAPTAWDLRLATGSALIDAGDAGILDTDGSTSDIGAYGGPGGDSW